MRFVPAVLAIVFSAVAAVGQDTQKAIYETERAFERTVAEKGINAAFVEFLSPVGVMFMPDAVNGREAWSTRPASSASLTWNPVWIDVASNGAMAYSVGNSQFRPKGKDDTTVYYGHYVSVWLKQPDGRFLAAFDTGINHPQPSTSPANWRSPIGSGKGSNPDKISAADSAVSFYQMAASSGPAKAYRSFLAEDAIVMRQGKIPAFSKKAALTLISGEDRINFSRRKSFTEAVDLAYVHAPYTMTDKKGTEVERGNFIQVWKFRDRKWEIVVDALVPLPKKS